MTPSKPPEGAEGRSGRLTAGGRVWTWEAVPAPADDDGPENPFLEWFRFTFRLEEDPEQEASARAGIAPKDWSDGTLRRILRSVRRRTWRGPDDRLWEVRLEGWAGRGISTEVAGSEEGDGPEVVYVPPDEGEEVRRDASSLASITLPEGSDLETLLENGA